MSSFLELAKTRRSVRTFDGKMPEKQLLDERKIYAEKADIPFGVKIRFAFLNAEENALSSPVLSGEKYYVSAVTSKQDHVEEAYGYSFEKLLMRAHELGLGTVWIGGTMPRDKFESASNLGEGEFMACVSPLGVASKKMSVKENLMRKGVKADSRKKFEELFFLSNFGTALDEERAKEKGLYNALEAVRLAPSAVNKQPWRIVIDGNTVHFYEKQDKGYMTPNYDLQKIDVGIAMYHFEAQMLSEGRNLELSTNVPNITVPAQVEYVASYSL